MTDPADDWTFDFSTVDHGQCVADLDAIRAVNPHRYEMELLTGVTMVDRVNQVIVGYKDVTADDFWCRGHMPGYPLMPGVLMIEAGAQLVSFFADVCKLVEKGKILGLGGVDGARFTRQVKPGERLTIAGKASKLTRRIVRCRCVGAVDGAKCFEATITGVVLPTGDREAARA
jgi:3-hydroxyacyl-[acyl-carrier-protein] dehydratase